LSEPHIRSVTNRSGRAHHLLDSQNAMTEEVEKIEETGDKVIKAITGGGSLPPEPAPDNHDHGGGKQPPSDQTVIVVSILYIAGGMFMIGLGVSALRAMQKRRKERGK
jgi:hypothetical protein